MSSSAASTVVSTLTKNTLLNLLSQGVYLALAFWGIPILIKGLGPDQFGLLALVWAVIGYFTLLDFGISRANTKFIAEVRAAGDTVQEHRIIWTSMISTFGVGLISGVIVYFCAPLIMDRMLSIGSQYRHDALEMFRLTAFGVPFMLLYGTLKGFQMAIQRFDQVNIFQIAIGVVQWVGSILLVHFQYSVYSIVLLTVVSRIVLTLVVAVSMIKIYPGFYHSVQFIERNAFKKIWSFGGWVFISQIISPLYLYIDRIFIAMFLTLSAVAYYSVPQEALSRLLVLTMSFTLTLFPAMSAQAASDDQGDVARSLYSRSLKYLVILSIPVTFCFIIFTREIVGLWMGPAFAEQTVYIFRILAVGLFFNSIAQIPNTVLHAYNRPDIPAKLHSIELPLVVMLNVILIPLIGVIGAAVAWSSRVIVDSVLHLMAVEYRIERFSFRIPLHRMILYPLGAAVTFLLTFEIVTIIESLFLRIAVTLLLLILYVGIVWKVILDDTDKKYMMRLRHGR